MSLTVLCPSRGRAGAAWQLQNSFDATVGLGTTRLVFVIDDDDPLLPEYMAPRQGRQLLFLRPQHEGGMVNALNAAVKLTFEHWPQETVVGFVGDDHRFRTRDWDKVFHEALGDRPGFVYGNDLFWGNGEIPTQIFTSAVILKYLGWMGLPGCTHLFIDNAWMELGQATGCIRYYKNIIIEHMHPAGGKVEWDEGHLRVNSPAMYGHDGEVFEQWRSSDRFLEDVQRVRLAISSPGPL